MHQTAILNEIKILKNLLSLLVAILVIGWVLGFLVYEAGALVHILLLMAAVVVLLRTIRGE